MVVRYFDSNKDDIVDALLDTIKVENGTAQHLYQAVKSLLKKRGIPFENIVGFGSDNCPTMMGERSGFKKLLKDDIPSVFIMGCICHSMALCASHAVNVLPSFLETFLKDVSSYLSRSSKRKRDFMAIQQVVRVVPHKMVKLSQTRWLSREKVLSTVIEQYDALILYFEKECKTDKVDGVRKIFDTLTNCGIKHMLLFLQYILQKVNAINTEFQSEQFRLHQLYTMITSEYKSILNCFIKEEILLAKNLSEIDPQDIRSQKPISDVYLGGQCFSQLLNDSLQDESGCYLKLCGRSGRNCPSSAPVLSGYNGSPDTRFSRGTTQLMSLPDGERCLRPPQSLVVSFLLSLVSTLVLSRTGGVLSLQSILTHRFPQFPLRNLCSLVMLAVSSLVFAAMDTAFF